MEGMGIYIWRGNSPDGVAQCLGCGAEAEYYGESRGCLCAACALEEWEELSTREKLACLGFCKIAYPI